MSSKVACLYIRVSTEDQTELSPDAQKRLLLDYAQKNDMIVSGDFIFTESVSGRHAQKRPEFQKMIALAKQPSHPIDVILVWKFSRFARNQEESIVYKSMLKKDNVDVISVSEPLIEGPFGSLIERIIEWMDEYYSIRLSGEVLRGMKEKALQKGYQTSNQEKKCQSITGHNCHQIIHRRDKRTRRNRRVNLYLVEKHRNHCAHKA